MTGELDTRAFTERLSRDERARAARLAGAAGPARFLGPAMLVMFGALMLAIGAALGDALPMMAVLATALVGLAGVLVAIELARGRDAERIALFADHNGMRFRRSVSEPRLAGVIFDIGSDRTAEFLVSGERGRPFTIANYRYTTGSGKHQQTHRWGYVELRLEHPLPHILLDATSNNGLFGSNLPVGFAKDQRLGVEGDFDEHFALYCPAGYERDALYLFTPDIMARFIDHAAALDVEIIDDRLYLYAKRPLSTTDAATWRWLQSVIDAMTRKLDQWARWRDDRLLSLGSDPSAAAGAAPSGSSSATSGPPALLRPPPGVAPPGRRLERGVPWGAIATIAIAAGAIVWIVAWASG